MDNPLVKNIFYVSTNKKDETEYLICNLCEKWDNLISVRKLVILLFEGSSYSTYLSGMKKPCPNNFLTSEVL